MSHCSLSAGSFWMLVQDGFFLIIARCNSWVMGEGLGVGSILQFYIFARPRYKIKIPSRSDHPYLLNSCKTLLDTSGLCILILLLLTSPCLAWIKLLMSVFFLHDKPFIMSPSTNAPSTIQEPVIFFFCTISTNSGDFAHLTFTLKFTAPVSYWKEDEPQGIPISSSVSV